MKALWIVILMFALAGTANAAAAKGTTAREMFDSCNDASQGGEYLLCQGFMAGFAQGVVGAQSIEGSKVVCLPDYFAGTELLAVFMRQMKSFPPESKSWSLAVGPVLYFIMSTQYPCKKS